MERRNFTAEEKAALAKLPRVTLLTDSEVQWTTKVNDERVTLIANPTHQTDFMIEGPGGVGYVDSFDELKDLI